MYPSLIRGSWIVDPDTGRLVPKEQYRRRIRNAVELAKLRSDLPSPEVMRDIQPFVNVAVDGTEITSRSQKREMMKRHNLQEVGKEFRKTKRQDKRKTPVAESLRKTYQKLGAPL